MKRTFRQVVNDGWKILREDIYGVRGVIIALALYFLFFRYILRSICPVVLVTGFPSAVFAWNRYILCRRRQPLLKKCVVALAVAMILFYLWLMYLYFPGEPPMSYYGGNLIARIRELLLHLPW